jgi:glycerol-3-phosphate dehydrogenase
MNSEKHQHPYALYDVVVIGGGIHGCAAAAHAALCGLSVLLVEKDDLASQTSSASSKLIHGGLRYLEQGNFQLVAQALQARRDLLIQAPHLVKPLGFMLPHTQTSRPKWQIQLGLKLYDFLARKDDLPRSRHLLKQTQPDMFQSLRSSINEAFFYYDARTDDARLTIENALRAQQAGALIQPRTCLVSASISENQWRLTLKPQHGEPYQVEAKTLINTAGPWVNQVLSLLGVTDKPEMTLVKGSHILLPVLYPGEHAYILQHPDQRIIFCIPYHGYTLVGTTDEPYQGDLTQIQMTAQEADYLCDILQLYFKTPICPQDIIHHYSGIRTLTSQPSRKLSALSRSISLHHTQTPAPVVTLYGGKLTTHQHTAQLLIDSLKPTFPTLSSPSSISHPFPGAMCTETSNFVEEIQQLELKFHWLPSKLFHRYINQYGTRIQELLNGCKKIEDLGVLVLNELYTKEIEFLCEQEWAQTADDILWRRTKLGLHATQKDKEKLETFLSSNHVM